MSNDQGDIQSMIAEIFDEGRVLAAGREDDAWTTGLAIAEESHRAMRALIGLMTAHPADSAESLEHVARNDLALLLGIVNRRIGQAVSQAKERKATMKEEAKPRPRRKKAEVKLIHGGAVCP
jgi:hypothetical protein